MKPLWAVVALSAWSGCIPLPYALPPVKLRAAVGGSAPLIGSAAPGSTALDFSVAAHPRQLTDLDHTRLFDFGVGYRLEALLNRSLRHTGFLEAAGFVPLDFHWRAVLHGSGDVTFRVNDQQLGLGSTFGVGLEYAGFVENSQTSSANFDGLSINVAHGEAGVGFDLSFSTRVFQGVAELCVTAGLTFRLPAAAGLLLINPLRLLAK